MKKKSKHKGKGMTSKMNILIIVTLLISSFGAASSHHSSSTERSRPDFFDSNTHSLTGKEEIRPGVAQRESGEDYPGYAQPPRSRLRDSRLTAVVASRLSHRPLRREDPEEDADTLTEPEEEGQLVQSAPTIFLVMVKEVTQDTRPRAGQLYTLLYHEQHVLVEVDESTAYEVIKKRAGNLLTS